MILKKYLIFSKSFNKVWVIDLIACSWVFKTLSHHTVYFHCLFQVWITSYQEAIHFSVLLHYSFYKKKTIVFPYFFCINGNILCSWLQLVLLWIDLCRNFLALILVMKRNKKQYEYKHWHLTARLRNKTYKTIFMFIGSK